MALKNVLDSFNKKIFSFKFVYHEYLISSEKKLKLKPKKSLLFASGFKFKPLLVR